MHGAFLSGNREASRVARTLRDNPLLLDLKTVPVPTESDLDTSAGEEEEEGDLQLSEMADGSEDNSDEEVEEEGDGERLLKLARDLKEMVQNREADLLFGCFTVFYPPTSLLLSTPPAVIAVGQEQDLPDVAGPSTTSVSDATDATLPSGDNVLCLVRVDFGNLVTEKDGEKGQSIPIFLAISRSDIYILHDVPNDKERLLVLRSSHGLGVKLEKRSGSLSEAAMARAKVLLRKGRTVRRTRPAVLRMLLDVIQSSPHQSPLPLG